MAKSTEMRQNSICMMLTQNSTLRVDELSHHFGVSEVTIRKDLRELEESGKLLRGHGIARVFSPPSNMNEPHSILKERLCQNYDEKLRIAIEAEKMVKDWDVVLLAPGSTCCMLAKRLVKRRNVIIVTNAVNFSAELDECAARIIYLGGEYNPRSGSTTGIFVMDALNSINIDRFFLGANGVIADVGVTSYEFDSMNMRTMIDRSKEVILLADHTKFGRPNALTLIDIKSIDTVITTSELDVEIQNKLKDNVRQVILA